MIYQKYAPNKVGSAEKIIRSLHPGKETAFIQKIRDKYRNERGPPPPPDPYARDELRRELTQLYARHAPDKVEMVDNIISKVKPGTEKSFLYVARKKYEDPNYVAPPPRKTHRSESETQHYTRELESLYQRYAPERVPSVAKILASVPPGREEWLMENAREKYKERELLQAPSPSFIPSPVDERAAQGMDMNAAAEPSTAFTAMSTPSPSLDYGMRLEPRKSEYEHLLENKYCNATRKFVMELYSPYGIQQSVARRFNTDIGGDNFLSDARRTSPVRIQHYSHNVSRYLTKSVDLNSSAPYQSLSMSRQRNHGMKHPSIL